MKIILPPKVKYIIDKIYEKGYEAYIVGGCVRDSIIGLHPSDYDITNKRGIIKVLPGKASKKTHTLTF